jgi:REP element-mobilizing transposase RayT
MPRPPRVQIAGGIYHVTARGNRKEDIFGDDSDRRLFLRLLELICARYGWRCHVYCLMNNHVHFVVETPQPNISVGMQCLFGRYAAYFNERHGLSGHLFQGRFHSVLIESDGQLLATARYILLNPVRARLCERPGEWKWGSFRALVETGYASPPVHVVFLLGMFGADLPKAREALRKFIYDAPERAGP